MDQSTLLSICVAGAVGLAGYGVASMMSGRKTGKLRERLSNAPDADHNAGGNGQSGGAGEAVVPILQKVGTAAAQPFMPKSHETRSSLRKQLAQAGIYSQPAVVLMAGARVICLVLGLGFGYLFGLATGMMFLGVPLFGLTGYFIPKVWLKMRIKANQKALNLALPDALDLMVVCVEAGLTVDSALQRVGQELVLAHPSLSRELGIAHMETRVGLSRTESLKNLGVRTNNASLQSLASMLVQAERFGTSIAQALRIHAETMRQKRQHAAEEMAAKASVKMSFPLVLFIFPATFIVLAGPTVIGLLNSALFTE